MMMIPVILSFQKLTRRQKAAKSIKWEEEGDKEKAENILAKEYMSTDESDIENLEEDGLLSHEDILKTLPRPWESQTLRKLKRKLDYHYASSCIPSSARAQLPRRISRDINSGAAVPKGAPMWAVQAQTNNH